MFREMRRSRQALGREECEAILERGKSGVLALHGDDGYPYAVPLSYVLCEGALYFHCARSGHKIDAVKGCDKASFCVVDRDDIVPEKFTTFFGSVIVFGKMRFVEDAEEIRKAMFALADKYSPGIAGREKELESSMKALCVLRMDIENMTGKEAIELVKMRGK